MNKIIRQTQATESETIQKNEVGSNQFNIWKWEKFLIFSMLLFTFGIGSTMLTSCEKQEEEKEENLYFTISIEVGAITKNSASCVVRLFAERGSENIYNQCWFLGLMWDDKGYPTHDTNGHIGFRTANMQSNSGPLQFTCQMTNLKPNTTYYVQGFATFYGYLNGDIKDGPVGTFRTSAE